ncbi:MAG: glycosyltransferase, partial [Actinomycetota bacterium]|nr:glycosyltransferase [Actinomycetota bacterium]
MSPSVDRHVGYVVKMYPRLSETFIVDEIRAVEAAGVEVSIFSLRAPNDGRFHADLARVAATAAYLPAFAATSTVHAMEIIGELEIDPPVVAEAVAFVRRLPQSAQAGVMVQALHLAREVRTRGIDHLHAHFMTVAAHVAHLAHLFTGVPFTVTAHAKDIFRHTVDAGLFRTVAGAAEAVVTVCDVYREHIEDRILD